MLAKLRHNRLQNKVVARDKFIPVLKLEVETIQQSSEPSVKYEYAWQLQIPH